MDLGPWKSVVLTWASPPQSLLLIVMILDWRGFLLAGEPATELGASHLFSLDLTAPQPGMSIFADGETEAQRSDLAGTQGVVQLLSLRGRIALILRPSTVRWVKRTPQTTVR